MDWLSSEAGKEKRWLSQIDYKKSINRTQAIRAKSMRHAQNARQVLKVVSKIKNTYMLTEFWTEAIHRSYEKA